MGLDGEKALYLRNYIGLMLLGMTNNLVYVLVGSAAASLAKSIDEPSFVGDVTWATNATGFLCRGVNAFLLPGVPYWMRVVANGLILVGGSVLTALAGSFGPLLVGVILVGTTSNFGESVILGYLKTFPPEIVGGWSAGTGLAGVFGSALYLGLQLAFSNRAIFLASACTVVVYWLAFGVIVRRPTSLLGSSLNSSEWLKEDGAKLVPKGDGVAAPPSTDQKRGLLDNVVRDADEDAVEEQARADDAAVLRLVGAVDEDGDGLLEGETRWSRILRIWKLVNWLSWQMGLVYYAEYVISQGAASMANPSAVVDAPDADFWHKNAYPILSFCYQGGVLISRSSLSHVKITGVHWLTVLQFVNLVLWLLQAQYHVVGVWVQFPAMFWVGLLGGASYVNVFYLLLQGNLFTNRTDRELGVNLASLYITMGIVLAGASSVILQKFIIDN